jgi:glyoxylase-like metal-dependent hydrolase (beta-lactamase superfamily II)
MKSTRVTDNLIQLTRFGAVNAFLVAEDDGFTLIDTMIKGSHDRLVRAASEAGRPITRILVTHAHDDHVGSLDALAAALPEAEVAAPARDALLIKGDTTPQPGEPEGKLRGSYPAHEVEFTLTVGEGDRIGSLEVVGAPGHSPGQMALLDTRDRSLIAGDAYSSLGGLATTAGPYWRFPLPGIVTWHRPTALESARKLRALEPRLLAVGHGKPVVDPLEAMDAALRRHV